MNGVTGFRPLETTRRTSTLAWVAVPVLVTLFYLATHDPAASLLWQSTLPGEVESLVGAISEGRMQRWIAFPALALFGGAALLLGKGRRVAVHLPLTLLIGTLLLWSVLSLGWSGEPAFTARRLIVFLMLLTGAAGLVRQLTLREVVGVLTTCAAGFLVLGIAVEVTLGTFHPLSSWYRFAGTQHPNQQGINCAILLLGSIYLAASGGRRTRRLAIFLAVVALAFLILTRSRTAFASGFVASVLLVMLLSSRPRAIMAGLLSAWAAGVLYLLFANGIVPAPWQALLLGRDAAHLNTLTGRTEIWALGLDRAGERPLLGYGYGTFWTPERTADIASAVQWKISEGHSAYLDMLLNLGIVGALLFIALLTVGMACAWLRHRRSADPAWAFVLAFLAFAAADGVLESALTIPNFFSFTAFVLLGSIAFPTRPATPERAHAQRISRERGLAGV